MRCKHKRLGGGGTVQVHDIEIIQVGRFSKQT